MWHASRPFHSTPAADLRVCRALPYWFCCGGMMSGAFIHSLAAMDD